MAISTEITIATAFSGGNLLLLGVLLYVWVGNYRTFRTPLVLGLLVFSLVFVLENLLAIHFFFTEQMLYGSDPQVQQVVVLLRGLQFVALLALVYVTLK